MFCPNCGKENPDGSRFCGYCGEKLEAPVEEVKEEQAEPVSVEEPVEETAETVEKVEEPVIEAVQEPEVTEEAVIEEVQETVQTEEVKPEEDIRDVEFTPVEEKKPEEKAEEPEPVKTKKHINVKKPEINWGQFKVFQEVLQDPFTEKDMGTVPLITTYVMMLITNLILLAGFRFKDSFTRSLLITIIILAGLLLFAFLDNRKSFNVKKAVQKMANMLVLPVICTFIAGICFSIAVTALSNSIYSLMLGNAATARIEIPFIIGMIFLTVAFISLIMTSVKSTKNISYYVQAAVYVIMIIAVLYIFYEGLLTSFGAYLTGLY